ncbi:unnamed protein product, partial [Tetraodon nigroviridis]
GAGEAENLHSRPGSSGPSLQKRPEVSGAVGVATAKTANLHLSWPGKLHNHLEAALHEAMSELDKMSASVSTPPPSSLLPPPWLLVTLFLLLLLLPDPVPGSPGEAAQAQEEEDLQIAGGAGAPVGRRNLDTLGICLQLPEVTIFF